MPHGCATSHHRPSPCLGKVLCWGQRRWPWSSSSHWLSPCTAGTLQSRHSPSKPLCWEEEAATELAQPSAALCSCTHPGAGLRQLLCSPQERCAQKNAQSLASSLQEPPLPPVLLGSDPSFEAPGADSGAVMLHSSAKCNYKLCKCDSKLNQQPEGRNSGDPGFFCSSATTF